MIKKGKTCKNKSPSLPLFPPDSQWTPPSELPAMRSASIIGLDLETHDPNLKENGPGAIWHDGHIAGISVCSPEHGSFYIPIRHPETECRSLDQIRLWLSDIIKEDTPVVGAKISYDLEWLRSEDIHVASNNIYDVLGLEVLIDNTRKSYSLDNVCKAHELPGKDESLLNEALTAYGYNQDKGFIAKLPARYVGPYAEADATVPIDVLKKQLKIIKREELTTVMELEKSLIKPLLDMRFNGVKVDLDEAERLNDSLLLEDKQLIEENRVNPNSPDDLVAYCKRNGITYNRTDAGNPSFTGKWLQAHSDPFLKKVASWRKMRKMRSDFIEGAILNKNKHGRIHSQFHPLINEDDEGNLSGTRPGRFSSSNPNLQQVPSRDAKWAPLIRKIFIPDEGKQWGKLDYSQQEPRLFVHFAFLLGLEGSEAAVRAFRTDPRTDYHAMTATMAGIERRPAKSINLGLQYGMMINKLSHELGVSKSRGQEILDEYVKALPFVPGFIEKCSAAAQNRGYVKTILGRRARFDLWEPARWDEREGFALPFDQAKKKWPKKHIVRAGTYKAVNRVIQGSAADQAKKALVECYQVGVLPQILVHDEFDGSYTRDEVLVVKQIMEDTVKLEIPVVVDASIGPSWGETYEDFK